MRGSQDVDVGYKFEEVSADGEEEEVGGVEENYELDLTSIEIMEWVCIRMHWRLLFLTMIVLIDDKKKEMNYYHHAAGRGSKFEYIVEDVTSYDQY